MLHSRNNNNNNDKVRLMAQCPLIYTRTHTYIALSLSLSLPLSVRVSAAKLVSVVLDGMVGGGGGSLGLAKKIENRYLCVASSNS